MKPLLGVALAVLLVLQRVQLVSSQTPDTEMADNGADPVDLPVLPEPIAEPEQQQNGSEDAGIMPTESSPFSGDGELQTINIPLRPKDLVTMGSPAEASGDTGPDIFPLTTVTNIPQRLPTEVMVTRVPESNDTQTDSPVESEASPSNDTETNSTESGQNSTDTEGSGSLPDPMAPTIAPTMTATVSAMWPVPALPDDTTSIPYSTAEPSQTVNADIRANSDSEQGLVANVREKMRGKAWSAIIGIGMAVGVLALVIYVILRKRDRQGFSHRKLEEDMPADPVLRLDNSEPLDLRFHSAYYNPGLQADNIQMTNFPKGQAN